MSKTVFAVAAHPDDIEFCMAGTLVLLRQRGYEVHYMNIANGSCGTTTLDTGKIVKVRTEEARQAAGSIGAVFHAPLCNDFEVFYEKKLLARLTSIVREVAPRILLTHSPQDYMEDHMNAGRLAVTAAFCRNMRNFPVEPEVAPVTGPVTVYHAQPHGNCDQLRQAVRPDMFVDITAVIDQKEKMLACHQSQKTWLDASQGMDSYLKTMRELSSDVGKLSGAYQYAEGWRRHLHLGFCDEKADPLKEALEGFIV